MGGRGGVEGVETVEDLPAVLGCLDVLVDLGRWVRCSRFSISSSPLLLSADERLGSGMLL